MPFSYNKSVNKNVLPPCSYNTRFSALFGLSPVLLLRDPRPQPFPLGSKLVMTSEGTLSAGLTLRKDRLISVGDNDL